MYIDVSINYRVHQDKDIINYISYLSTMMCAFIYVYISYDEDIHVVIKKLLIFYLSLIFILKFKEYPSIFSGLW